MIAIFSSLFLAPQGQGTDNATTEYYLQLKDIRIRDPNIIWHEGEYYMTGTTAGDGFLGYSSKDLEYWKAQGYIYTRNESLNWANYSFWAPEMVERDGKFYLFFSGKSDETRRATGVAVAEHPMGPYHDFTSEPLTPPEYECLDGHLFRAPNGTEYLVYVYEWVQAGKGEMWIQPIAPDYSHLLGEPIFLFRGTDARWSSDVVDGPSMLYINDTYFLFWSSFSSEGYCCGYAESPDLFGSYTQSQRPVITGDGGHSTWFREADTGQLLITYHQPNSKTEHAVVKELRWNAKLGTWEVYPPESEDIAGFPRFWIIIVTFWCVVVVIWRSQLRDLQII